jgi:hypothetical protein
MHRAELVTQFDIHDMVHGFSNILLNSILYLFLISISVSHLFI